MSRRANNESATEDRKSWPRFLDLLDSEPERALEGLYRLATRTVATVPPRPIRGLPRHLFQDYFHDFILACCKDRFRKLRKYGDVGRPFAGWLYVVACKYAYDWLAKLDRPVEDPDAGDPGAADDSHLSGVLEAVRRAMKSLSDKCRLLLKLAAEEYTPKEMTLALGWQEDENARASNDLRYCRKKLRQALTDIGIDIEEELEAE